MHIKNFIITQNLIPNNQVINFNSIFLTSWHESLPMLRTIIGTRTIIIMVQMLSVHLSMIRREVLWEVLRSIVRLVVSVRHIVAAIHFC